MPNFHTGLEKNPANYTPLTPIDFIERTANIYPDQTAIVYKDYEHNNLRQSWGETYNRCRKMSDALKNWASIKTILLQCYCPIPHPWLKSRLAYRCLVVCYVP